ncbi:MAG: phosphate ABC transporter permease subunit PstC [Myxococcaceae bacterium]
MHPTTELASVQGLAASPPTSTSPGGAGGDRAFSTLLGLFGGVVLIIAGLIIFVLGRIAAPAFGPLSVREFLVSQEWNPVTERFGAFPFVYGTLVTSGIALLVAVPVSLGMALFLTEMAPRGLGRVVRFGIETLASIPSVIYGLWALFILVPLLREQVEPFLARAFGFLPLFQGTPLGLGYLAAGLVLAVMVLPTIAAVSTEVLRNVPASLKHGGLALGATRWETIRSLVLPYARPGIFGAVLLGLGRALGETMAVTMVIGNQPEVHASLFAPGYSLPSVIANEFAEATSTVHVGALAALGLVLFGVILILNGLARLLVKTVSNKAQGILT